MVEIAEVQAAGDGGDAPRQNEQQAEQGGGGISFASVFRFVVMYVLVTSFMKGINNPKSAQPSMVTDETGVVKQVSPHSNLWKDGILFDLQVYISESEESISPHDEPTWSVDRLAYNWDEANEVSKQFNITVTEGMASNATVYAHIFFVKTGKSIDPSSSRYDPKSVIHRVHPLVKHFKRPKMKKEQNLITGADPLMETDVEIQSNPDAEDEYIPYWKPTLHLHLVHDHTVYARGSIPPQIYELMEFDHNGKYWPPLFINEFWLMREHMLPVNATVKELPIEMSYNTLGLFKWQLMSQMDKSMEMQSQMGMHGNSDGANDEMKRMLADTNPWLLGITAAVSVVHMLFDFLAFKNDIQFWRSRKSMEGLSSRTIVLNCIMSVIIFLYLVDNDTSWMILMSSGMGLVIEVWKIRKCCHIHVTWNGMIPSVSLEDKIKGKNSEATKEHDEKAFKYMSRALFPLVVCYSFYSLFYDTHKSWYSWILGSLVGAVYTFGFIMMTPQLFINYKLKSVAHLPWRVLIYKALNTFIDDLFAFIIKMPTMHRLSCFRDDIIFFIYLYQRWKYPVDKNRGFDLDKGDLEPEAEKKDTGENDSLAAVPPSTVDEQQSDDEKAQDGVEEEETKKDK